MVSFIFRTAAARAAGSFFGRRTVQGLSSGAPGAPSILGVLTYFGMSYGAALRFSTPVYSVIGRIYGVNFQTITPSQFINVSNQFTQDIEIGLYAAYILDGGAHIEEYRFPRSSFLSHLFWHSRKDETVVVMHGEVLPRIYVYFGITENLIDNWIRAESAGQFYNEQIKGFNGGGVRIL